MGGVGRGGGNDISRVHIYEIKKLFKRCNSIPQGILRMCSLNCLLSFYSGTSTLPTKWVTTFPSVESVLGNNIYPMSLSTTVSPSKKWPRVLSCSACHFEWTRAPETALCIAGGLLAVCDKENVFHILVRKSSVRRSRLSLLSSTLALARKV